MNELQPRPGESASAWLARLRSIDAARLPQSARYALEACLAYARFLLANRAADRPTRTEPTYVLV